VKLKRIYYKNLRKALLISLVSLYIFYRAGFIDGNNDNYFTLSSLILTGFFSLTGIIILIVRIISGYRYRRRFSYSFWGVINFTFSIYSILISLLHHMLYLPYIVYILSLLMGAIILYDIFLGKREKKEPPEILIEGS